jgi:hypothetical protein
VATGLIMGANGKLLPRVCAHCGAKETLTTGDARRSGWTLWSGSAYCPRCPEAAAIEAKTQAARMVNKVLAAPFGRVVFVEAIKHPAVYVGNEKVVVECIACGDVGRAPNMHEDGWHPSIHWHVTEENKRALREQRIPIPLCPGMKLPGKVIKVELPMMLGIPEAG